ncbi:MAG: aminotransferase class V-fold PLP-dependent enzyme [Clostridiales bacterium]|nr:aminotransferase class V-fold PLP-dependent enzyme [Clostridiales bacterium]
MRNVYLDNGSTSFPKAPGVGRAMLEFIENVGCNVNRGGYRSSYSLSEKILETREKLRDFFGFNRESNVVFTPNVTFSLNYIIHGLLRAGDRLIITSMEHNAVARPAETARLRGVDLAIARCDEKGCLDLEDFKRQITADTKAVVMLHGSNVCGSLMPVVEVGKLCKERGVFFIVDAAQTAGVFPIHMKEMNINGLAFTGHKGLLGPQGIGGLLLDDKLAQAISPIIDGGTGSRSDSIVMPDFMPDKLEPGTMNLPGILGLSAALDYVVEKGVDNIRAEELKLTRLFMEAFISRSSVRVVGPGAGEERCPIVSLDFTDKDNAEVAFRLDNEFGIMTRCGMHCAPLAHKTLKTFPQGTVRFAFGHRNTEEEVAYAVDAIERILGD